MAITETISLQDEVSAAADKASASVDKLASSFDGVNKAAVTAASAAASAASKAALGEIEAAQGALKHAKSLKDVAKAQARVTKAINKSIAAEKKLASVKAKAAKSNKKGSKASTAAVLKNIAAFNALQASINLIKGGIEIGLAVKKTAEWAAETIKSKREMKNMLDVLTKGRGEEALGRLTLLSSRLNISVGDATKSFTRFRKAGLDNKASISMIKLKADIEALIGKGPEAAEAIDGALERIKGGEKASKVMKEVAESFKVTGDGSKAAAVKIGTIDGKLKSTTLKLEEMKKSAATPLADIFLKLVGANSANVAVKGITKSIDGLAKKQPGKAITASMQTAAGQLPGIGKSAAAGFLSGFDLVGGVKAMAAKAIAAVKGAFKTKSPSAVFEDIGANVSAGFRGGVEDAPAPTLPTPALAAAPGGGGDISVNINVEGATDPEATASAIRREVVNAFNQMAMSGGGLA